MSGMARPIVADGGKQANPRPLFSLEAEQAVLGGLMLANDAWDKLVGIIGEDDFYASDHRSIYGAIERLIRDRRGADILTVTESLKASGELAGIERGMAYVHELADSTPSAANILRYAEIVRERALMRRLHKVAADFMDLLHEADDQSAMQILDRIQETLSRIALARVKGRGELLSIASFINKTIEELEDAFRNHETRGISGISTGFLALDDKIAGGLKPGQLIVVAARPGVGKTAIALNIAEDVALRQHLAAGVFSMEMHATELVKRQLAGMAQVHGLRLAHGRIDQAIWGHIGEAAPKLHAAPIYLCEDGYLTISEITAGARKLKRLAPTLGLLVIDYLGLMRIERPTSNRAQDLAEISRGLKALAKELAIPIMLLAQLNREVEKRSDKRPVLSDLRDSGEIEADADLVLMLYREAIYREMEDSDINRARAEVLIRKQRNGPTGKVILHYADWCTRFSDWNPR